MALITKQDTDGSKAILIKGELGYDDYVAGGDSGRAYVGTGTENIPLAKKSETDALTSDLSNHTESGGTSHALASQGISGFMSSTDKAKLDNIEEGATNFVLPATVVNDTDYATSATAGVVTMRVDGATLYIRNDGVNA